MLALTSTTPPAVLSVFSGNIADINVAGKWQANRVANGYVTPDGLYKLVSVVTFVVPGGQRTVGLPTYSINAGTGVVTESYTTEAIPAGTFIPWGVWLSRLTAAEYLAIKKAIVTQINANNATVAVWYDKSSSQGITLDAATATVKAMAVSASLLTQQRADIVFTP